MTAPLTARQFAVALGIRAALLYGSLQLQHVPWPVDHGICGPWGCGPPLGALIACHAGWFAFLAGPAWMAKMLIPIRSLRIFGIAGLLLAVGGLIGVAIVQSMVWWPQANAWVRPYWFQRYLFETATLVDLPVLQTAAIGSWFLAIRPPGLRLHTPTSEAARLNRRISARTPHSQG